MPHRSVPTDAPCLIQHLPGAGGGYGRGVAEKGLRKHLTPQPHPQGEALGLWDRYVWGLCQPCDWNFGTCNLQIRHGWVVKMGREQVLDRAEAPALVSHPAGATVPCSSVGTELAIEVTNQLSGVISHHWGLQISG